MKVANVEGFYNSRCQLCKFHIQFKLKEYKCPLNPSGIKEAIKNLDEDAAASLTFNLSINGVLFIILLVVISGHIKTGLGNREDYFNIKFIIL